MSAAEEIQKIENDIRSHSARLEETTALKPVTSHGVFFYFLPFFIGSFLVYFFTLLGCIFLNFYLTRSGSDSAIDGNGALSFFLPAVSFALVHIIGGIVARKLRDNKSEEADRTVNERHHEVEKLKRELVDLKAKKIILQKRISADESAVSFENVTGTAGCVSTIAGCGETPEDAVRLADYLADKFDSIQKLESDIGNCERQILNHQSYYAPARYTSFKFFLPFFIASLIIALFVFVVLSIQAFLMQLNDDPAGKTLSQIGPYIPFVIIMVLHVIGGVYARNKRDKLNSAIDDYENSNKKNCEELQKKCIELKSRLKIVQEETAEFDSVIPPSLRKRSGMVMVRKTIVSGKAQTIDEAVKILSVSARTAENNTL